MSTCSNCRKLQEQLDECKKELEKSKDNFKAHKADLEEYINRMEQGEKVLKSGNKELRGHIEYLTKQLDEYKKELKESKDSFKAYKTDLEGYRKSKEQGEKVLKTENEELRGRIKYLTKQLDERDKELQRVKNRYKTNHQASLMKNEPYKRKIVKKINNNKNSTTFKEKSLANY